MTPRAKLLTLCVFGAAFALAIGVLLWTATEQRLYVWLAMAAAFVVFVIGVFSMRRSGSAPPS